jgi:hypothetical protein
MLAWCIGWRGRGGGRRVKGDRDLQQYFGRAGRGTQISCIPPLPRTPLHSSCSLERPQWSTRCVTPPPHCFHFFALLLRAPLPPPPALLSALAAALPSARLWTTCSQRVSCPAAGGHSGPSPLFFLPLSSSALQPSSPRRRAVLSPLAPYRQVSFLCAPCCPLQGCRAPQASPTSPARSHRQCLIALLSAPSAVLWRLLSPLASAAHL